MSKGKYFPGLPVYYRLIVVSSGHQLGNSIAVMRQLYNLGVRYVTLTHTCHNAFADSCGTLPTKWGGLRCASPMRECHPTRAAQPSRP